MHLPRRLWLVPVTVQVMSGGSFVPMSHAFRVDAALGYNHRDDSRLEFHNAEDFLSLFRRLSGRWLAG